ncbi:fumarylacetoacetate hydrolase family protein [Clostridium sp. KNHs216]|uniref:fumarylacetoacetate hydrolase family protein n=1 Tax=Clostridium sp. KNHs216 TaxID=1550235 RepID=UPI00115278FE|nr:fumarylacetoacetate hydrolase family protein [Clostridium sp. KNHs216]TQI65943.1 2-keto-4-pentenoate hydratase/2-oxohepta-3-ene-1,7-dioic acid hydratase in catechol pathway [Clostridium sp. KNHs216]
MKLLTYLYGGKGNAGVLSKDGTGVFPFAGFGLPYEDMNSFIRDAGMDRLSEIQRALDSKEDGAVPFQDIQVLAPIPVPAQDIICLGVNFLAHAEESARYKKETFERDQAAAVYFSKRVDRAVPNGGLIDGHFDIVDSLDYEAELAVVIGRDARNVPEKDVFSYVLGYTVMNDVSARNIQTRHKQWYFGKSLDGFTPMGPWIVTEGEFTRPPVLSIQSRVNGEIRQDSTTGLFITSIESAVSELSRGMTLKAGTILSMGTPAGVGMGFCPPRFLKSGDVVECEVEKIGTLRNTVQ